MFKYSCFFLPHPPTTETYTLSLHDALPISSSGGACCRSPSRLRDSAGTPSRPCETARTAYRCRQIRNCAANIDRKSTRLNSSHVEISYAVFCLKKKKNKAFVQNSLCSAVVS